MLVIGVNVNRNGIGVCVCVCRFVDEMVTAGVLRLFEVFLGDGPTLTLLMRDDVWGRSEDWRMQIMGECATLLFLCQLDQL